MTESDESKHQLDDTKLQQVIKLHLVQGLPQAKVAEQLQTNQTEISRLLKRARDQHLIKLTVLAPAASDATFLEEKFGLRKVVIVPSGADLTATLDELGDGVANYLVDREIDHGHIGISCGSTMLAVAKAFARFPTSRLPRFCEVYPLNAVRDDYREVPAIVASTIHPATIVGSLVSALPDAIGTSYLMDTNNASDIKRALERLTDLDHYIIGIGAIDFEGKKRAAASNRTSHEFNTLMWAIDGATEALAAAVGELAYQPFSKDGVALFAPTSLPKKLEELRQIIAYFPISELKKRVNENKANVIAVAGGLHKVVPIHTALKMGVCNVLVTDSATGAAIVERARESN